MTGMRSKWPRITATSRAWYVTPSSCLKRGLVRLVDDDQAEIAIGQEQGGARADRHHLASPRAIARQARRRCGLAQVLNASATGAWPKRA